jgi:hypothetical protein
MKLVNTIALKLISLSSHICSCCILVSDRFDILKLQTATYVKIRSLDLPANTRKNDHEKIDFLLDQYRQYSCGDISLQQYVKSIGYKYAEFCCWWDVGFEYVVRKLMTKVVISWCKRHNIFDKVQVKLNIILNN